MRPSRRKDEAVGPGRPRGGAAAPGLSPLDPSLAGLRGQLNVRLHAGIYGRLRRYCAATAAGLAATVSEALDEFLAKRGW